MPKPSDTTRRELLAGGLAGLALLPGWLGRAFAQDVDDAPATAPDPAREALAAFRRARRVGKPLLVLLIPESDQRAERGHLWGEVLQGGGNEALALFALCEVVCVPAAGLHALLPSFAYPTDTLAVLVETHRVPALAAAVRASPPSLPSFVFITGRVVRSDDDVIDERIATVTEALRAVLAGTDEQLEARARLARRRLPQVDRDRVIAAIRASRPVAPALADRAAAIIALEARRAPTADARVHAERTLAAAAAHRLVDQPPDGSATRWGTSTGCATTWERTDADRAIAERRRRVVRAGGRVYFLDEMIAIGCGMGHVPARSRRFLYFYAASRERH